MHQNSGDSGRWQIQSDGICDAGDIDLGAATVWFLQAIGYMITSVSEVNFYGDRAMKSASNYARIINFLHTSKNAAIEEGCEEVLAFVLTRQSQGFKTKITDLVQSLMFGTGPTVHRKVGQLNDAGLIHLTRSTSDARAKNIEVATQGIQYLEEQYEKLEAVMKTR